MILYGQKIKKSYTINLTLFPSCYTDSENKNSASNIIKMTGKQGRRNPIPLNILRFRAKTMPQIKGKRQGVAKLATTRGEQG